MAREPRAASKQPIEKINLSPLSTRGTRPGKGDVDLIFSVVVQQN
jgi:hypothetical protein